MKRSLISVLHNRRRPIANAWRVFMLRGRGVTVGAGCKIGRGVEINLPIVGNRQSEVILGRRVELEARVFMNGYGGRIQLDDHVYVGPYTVIYGHGGVTIGEGTLIAMHCRIVSGNHTIPPRDTTIRSQPDIRKPISIGKDVWLSAGVTVLAGVTIGDGAVIGAGAVVTRDVPPFAVAVGIPAKVVRYRE